MTDVIQANFANFSIRDLAPFTVEKAIADNASQDSLLLLVGMDDVHEALKYLLRGVKHSLKLTMFGYDDEELNDIIWDLIENPNILVQITLDKSQADGVHEKKLLDMDKSKDLTAFSTHIAIGQSATHQIIHTKGAVLDGVVLFEGSTNWSTSGEGVGTVNTVGYKAQENTCTIMTCPRAIAKFTSCLDRAHATALSQMKSN